jgi:Ran GTPase-activating protein (RanGAP) involved in mRNA processing and transport
MSHQGQGINAVTEYLRDIVEKKPYTQDLALDFKYPAPPLRSISDLLPYLHLLDRLPKLKKLSLHGNRIKELPTDLSMLRNVEELDLTNNLLD